MPRYIICPGFPRCGTSTLFNLLVQHPEICTPSSKEVGFFLTDYTKGLDYYKKKLHVNDSCGTAIDFTPWYAIDDSVSVKMNKLLGGDMRLVFMVREPLRRLKSHLFMERRLLHENLPFKEALERSEEDRIARSREVFRHDHGFNYVKGSMYGSVISRYMDIIPRELIKIVVFEEFIEDMGSHLRDICSFIDINPDYDFNPDVNRNTNIVASRLGFIDRLGSRINNLNFIRQGNWKNGYIRKFAGSLRRKLLAYSEADYFNHIDIPEYVVEKIQTDVKLLEKVSGRSFVLWNNGYMSR